MVSEPVLICWDLPAASHPPAFVMSDQGQFWRLLFLEESGGVWWRGVGVCGLQRL